MTYRSTHISGKRMRGGLITSQAYDANGWECIITATSLNIMENIGTSQLN